MSSFDGKFFMLYFAWISPVPFCTILTQNINWHNFFSLSVYFILLKVRNCGGPILLIMKEDEKSIKIDKVMPGNIG